MSLLLSIGIPTYDRNEQLVRQVRAVISQCQSTAIELVICDNHSPTPVEESLKQAGLFPDPRIRLIRNVANIGLGANFNRTLEHCQGKWVWLLGDDDLLENHALEIVLTGIAKIPDAMASVLHKFASIRENHQGYPDQTLTSLDTLCQLAKDPWFFSDLLFISTSVFHRETYLNYLKEAYHWNHTAAPYLASVFCAIRDGIPVTIHSQGIIHLRDTPEAQQWNLYRVRLGLMSLAAIEGAEQSLSSMLAALFRQWYGDKLSFWIHLIHPLRSNRDARFWKIWHLHLAAISSGLTGVWHAFLALAWLPICNGFPIQSILRKKIQQRNDMKGLHRM